MGDSKKARETRKAVEKRLEPNASLTTSRPPATRYKARSISNHRHTYSPGAPASWVRSKPRAFRLSWICPACRRDRLTSAAGKPVLAVRGGRYECASQGSVYDLYIWYRSLRFKYVPPTWSFS